MFIKKLKKVTIIEKKNAFQKPTTWKPGLSKALVIKTIIALITKIKIPKVPIISGREIHDKSGRIKEFNNEIIIAAIKAYKGFSTLTNEVAEIIQMAMVIISILTQKSLLKGSNLSLLSIVNILIIISLILIICKDKPIFNLILLNLQKKSFQMNVNRENKLHIGFFGRCNTGKSSLINLLVGQQISIVSANKGTTTDIVKKTMELYGVGPVVLIDTAGIDDDSLLSEQRIAKTNEAIDMIDFAVIIISNNQLGSYEYDLINNFNKKNIPFIFVYNQNDITPISSETKELLSKANYNYIITSIKDNDAKDNLSNALRQQFNNIIKQQDSILKGIIKENDIVVLVTPIDSSAPKGRIILPQVKIIRDILDNKAINIVIQPSQLEVTLKSLVKKPRLVITDSQAFNYVDKIVPQDIDLTSFSVVLAKEKGCFEQYLKGTPMLDCLEDGDKILMLESCSHQPTCEDIGRVKLPKLIKKYSGKDVVCQTLAGITNQKQEPKDYKLVIQCGGCVATEKQLHNKLQPFIDAGVAVSNYGLAIAYMNGIFDRSIKIFKH